jgi:purine nucleoside phosphorylase
MSSNHPFVAKSVCRFHYYEGKPLDRVTFPIRVFKALAVENVLC